MAAPPKILIKKHIDVEFNKNSNNLEKLNIGIKLIAMKKQCESYKIF